MNGTRSLHVREAGPKQGPGGVWVHGWMGDGGDGAPLADALGMRLRCPDLPGHGQTPLADWTLSRTIHALAELAETCDWAGGYSMGGRLLMLAAHARPHCVRDLVLESAFPGYASEEDREDRREVDRQRAESLRRAGVEAFCRDWYRNPMWGGMAPPSRRGVPAELAGALERFGSGRQPDLLPWLRHAPQRVLWLAGRRDTAYAERVEWVRAHTRHRAVLLNAGHAAHRMDLQGWARQVRDFLMESPAKEQ